MISAADIRQKLAMLARHQLSLNAFEEWIDPYILDLPPDSDAADLVHSLQLLFAERDNRRLNSPMLYQKLISLSEQQLVITLVATLNQAPSVALIRAAYNNAVRSEMGHKGSWSGAELVGRPISTQTASAPWAVH